MKDHEEFRRMYDDKHNTAIIFNAGDEGAKWLAVLAAKKVVDNKGRVVIVSYQLMMRHFAAMFSSAGLEFELVPVRLKTVSEKSVIITSPMLFSQAVKDGRPWALESNVVIVWEPDWLKNKDKGTTPLCQAVDVNIGRGNKCLLLTSTINRPMSEIQDWYDADLFTLTDEDKLLQAGRAGQR